jgi:hypothetical protein
VASLRLVVVSLDKGDLCRIHREWYIPFQPVHQMKKHLGGVYLVTLYLAEVLYLAGGLHRRTFPHPHLEQLLFHDSLKLKKIK